MNDASMVWMNGKLMRADEVRVSPFDLGLTVGLGLFETMQAYDGSVFAFDSHYDRMSECVTRVIGGSGGWVESATLKQAISDVLDQNDLLVGRARVRMSLSAGANPLLGGGENPGNLIITATPQDAPKALARLVISPYTCNKSGSLAGVKTSSYASHIAALRSAQDEGADEAVILNSEGYLCECSVSNLFLVIGGVIYTPSLEAGCLNGVTRRMIIELCGVLGLEVKEGLFPESYLLDADEIFITSSIREVQPAVMLGGDSDQTFLWTRKLADAYSQRRKQGMQ